MAKKKTTISRQIEKEIVSDTEKPAGKRSLSQQVVKTKSRSKSYVMDLRIHSPASLGYLAVEGIDTAPALVRLAKVKGLDLIAVTDFYSGDFIDRILEAARESALTVIPGVVLRAAIDTCDDIIISCLFDEDFGTKKINDFLRKLGVPKSAAGDSSYIVKEPLPRILELLESYGGTAMPTRMDQTPYRLSAIPILVEQYGFRAFDLAYPDSVKFFKERWPKINFQLFSFSNANALAQVGTRIAKVKMTNPGFAGLKQVVGRELELS